MPPTATRMREALIAPTETVVGIVVLLVVVRMSMVVLMLMLVRLMLKALRITLVASTRERPTSPIVSVTESAVRTVTSEAAAVLPDATSTTTHVVV